MGKYTIFFFILLTACLSELYGQAPVITPKPPQIILPLDGAGNYTVKVGDIADVANTTDSVTHVRFSPTEFACTSRGPQQVNLTAWTNGSATNLTPHNVSFNGAIGLAFDGVGNCFVAENVSYQIRKISPQGEVTVYAGTGVKGFRDGPAAGALFAEMVGITCDAQGNVYIADSGNSRIRKISTDGVVSTYAGSGIQGTANGKAGVAQFYQPNYLSFDSDGNLFVSENGNFSIRKISADGMVSTLAGNGVGGYNDGTGAAASFRLPLGVAVDSHGNIFICDAANNRIRKITPDGAVTTYAGNGQAGLVNGPALSASFNGPRCIAIDNAGNMFIGDKYAVRIISPAGVVSTLAGSNRPGSSNGTGVAAGFDGLQDITIDLCGNVYVADGSNALLRKIDLAGRVTDYAGDGLERTKNGNIGASSCQSSDATIPVQVQSKPSISTVFNDVDTRDCSTLRDYTINAAATDVCPDATIKFTQLPAPGMRLTDGVPVKVTITATNETGGTDTKVFTVNASNTASLPERSVKVMASSQKICAGNPVTFSTKVVNGEPGLRYQWLVNGIKAGPDAPEFTTSSLKDGDVVNCAVSTASYCVIPNVGTPVAMSVSPYPTIDLDPAEQILTGDNIPLVPTFTGDIVTYTWTPAAGLSNPNIPSPVANPAVTTTYHLKVTTTGGCDAGADVTVTVVDRVRVTASAQNVCAGNPVTFTADVFNAGANPRYRWLVNGKNTGPDAPEFTTSSLKDGDVVNCEVTTADDSTIPNVALPVTMSVTPYPTIGLKPTEQILPGDGIRLAPDITGDIITYTWTPAAGLSNPNIQSPVASPAITTKYHLKVITAAGCDAGADITVTVATEVKIPNAFTPNGDGVNDIWNIDALINYPDCTVNIFNRYGQLLYKSAGYAKAWNGTYKGKVLPTGPYYYVIDLKDGSKPRSGQVSIIR